MTRAPVVLAALALLLSRPAAAAYSPESGSWDGLSYLAETAEEAKVDLTVLEALDLAALERGDLLLWVYPGEGMDTESALSFIRDGGHIVLLDDFGGSDELLSGLGVHKLDRPPRHDSYFRGSPHFPVFKPEGEHFLYFNITAAGSEIVANHPTAFLLDAPDVEALVSYAGGEAFIAEAREGRGRLLAVADASLVINEMQRLHGDKQLVANLMRYYCAADECRVMAVVPSTEVTGEYVPVGDRELTTLDELIRDSVSLINELVVDLSESLAGPPVRDPLTLAVLAAALLLLLVALRIRGGARRFAWQRPPALPRSDAELLAVGLASASSRADLSRPMERLRHVVERALEGTLPGSQDYRDPAIRERLAMRFASTAHPGEPARRQETRRKLLNVLSCFAKLRSRAASPDEGQAPFETISINQFEAIYEDARHVLDLAGAAAPSRWRDLAAGAARPRRREVRRHVARDPQGLHR